jgi:hypothetical protein
MRRSSLGPLPRRRLLGLEKLERREVLSGDVMAEIRGGTLFIRGDSGDNNIVITGGAPGQVIVAGGSILGASGTETNVNGSSAPVVLTGFVNDIIIHMEDGNDRVVLTNINVPGAIYAYLGNGDDVFLVQSRDVAEQPFFRNDATPVAYGNVTTDGSVVVFGNSGDDTMGVYDARIGGALGGDIIFYGGDGDDSFLLDGTTQALATVSRNVLLDMGWGDDIISMSRATIGDSVLIYDGGATVGSTVTLTSLNVDRNVRMYLSIGQDNVIIRGEDTGANRFTADNLVVFTGHDVDDVLIENISLTNLTLDTGHGDEGNGYFGIRLRQLIVAERLWVNSGDGFDNILLEDANASVVRVFTGDGSDGLIVRNLTALDAVFDTGEEGDVVGIYDSDFERLVIGLFAGDDQLYINRTRVRNAATFDGGPGNDTYFDLGGNNYQAHNFVSMENQR